MRTFALALTFTFGVLTSACDKGSSDGESTPPAPACTKDAKVCPDGSSVGRTGPDCEFAPCPGDGAGEGGETPPADGEQVMCTMDAKICPDGTGVGRVPPSCEFAPCPGE